MKRFLLPLTLLFSLSISQDIWINEIHYDNYGTDEGEFIEIAATTSMNISSASVTLYNGNSGYEYDNVALSQFTQGSTQDGYTFYYYSFPSNGIQNGAPDAISLENGNVVQFISYEGTMIVYDGAANGMTSVDIGVSEPGEIGESLQLQGIGTSYDSFSWVGPIPATMGSVNTNQILGDSGTIYGCIDPDAVNYNEAATDDDGSCLYSTEMSIYEIQYTTDQGEYCYESASVGQYATTTGIVTAVGPSNPNFFIQDFNSESYSGIFIYDNAYAPVVGDEVTISGTVNEYYSFTQLIDLTSYAVNSSGNAVSIKDITTGDLANGCTESGESLEGMLVRVSNVTVTTASNDYNEWYVDDGSGPCQIDDGSSSAMFDGVWLSPNVGDSYMGIVGVVDYSYNLFGILPRYTADLVIDSTLPFADAGEDQFVDPGATVTLNGSNSYAANGTIIAYEWVQIAGPLVVLDDDESSVTSFTAPEESSDMTFRLSIWDSDFNENTDEVTISVVTATTIEDIQYTLNQGEYCYETPMSGETVTTYGVVTHITPGTYPNFFLQDPNGSTWSGIYVYDTSVMPGVGDELQLTGTVNEYYSFTQIIDVTSSSLLTIGNVINPIQLNASDIGAACSESSEMYESMLVSLSDVTFDSVDEFGNWVVSDASGPAMVDDYYFDGTFPSISQGDTYECVSGVLGYSYSEFKLYPRNAADFECQEDDLTLPVADAGEDQFVAPGATVTLDGSNSYDANGTIIAYEWVQIAGSLVVLDDDESSVTSFTAPEESSDMTFMLSIWDSDSNEDTDEVTISVVTATTIEDIQYTLNQGEYCYETPMSGETVTTYGVVTHITPGTYPNFFLQDPNGSTWSGIYVYDTSVMPGVGDELQLTGTVNEYYSFTQIIDVSSFSIIDNGNYLTPIPLTSADIGYECSESSEMYESMLVSLSNVTFNSVDEFGNWMVSDGTGTSMVDDYYFDGTFPSISQGDTYECVSGVLGYSYSEFKLYPRNAADFECQEVGCTADGDVNVDGALDILDIVNIINEIMDIITFTENEFCTADINQDGNLNILDVVQIVNMILNR